MKSAILLTIGAMLCCAGQAEAAYGERISSHMKSPKKYDVTTVTSKLTKPAPKWKPVTLKPATVSTTTPLPSTNAPVNTETMDMSTDNGGQHDEGNQTISGSQSEATFRYVVPPVSPYDQNGIVLLNSLNRPDLRVNDHHQAGPVASLPVYSDHGSPLPARPVDHYSPPLYHDNYQPQVDQQQSYAPPLSNYEPGVSYTNVPSYQSSQNGGHPEQQAYQEEPLEAYLEQSAPAYHHPPAPANYGPPSPPLTTVQPYRVVPMATPFSSLLAPPPASVPTISYTEPEPDYNGLDGPSGISGIPGIPWKDYPIYSEVPKTSFDCKLTKFPGFYADIDAGCQVWHYCQLDGRHDAFLCPNGTMFSQEARVCDWWYNVQCADSPFKYGVNSDLY